MARFDATLKAMVEASPVDFPRLDGLNLLRGVTTMKESSTYQAIVQEGIAQGKIEGRAEGRTEGRTEGARDEAIRFLMRIAEHRFGPAAPTHRELLDTVRDVQKLEELGERVYEVTNWDELLEPIRLRRKGRRKSP